MKREVITRDVTEDGEPTFVEISVRLSNGHFESKMSCPLTGNPESVHAAVEAWLGAMHSVLPKLPVRDVMQT